MSRFTLLASGHRMALAFPILAVSAAAVAQDGFPITTDRPSFSDGTGIIPKGRWQIEIGYTFAKVDRSELETFGELLFRFPMCDRVEIRLSNVTFARANGAGGGGKGMLDPIVGLKYRFQTGVTGKTPDLAFVVQTTIPEGDRDFRVDENQPTAKFAGYYQADADDGFGWNVNWSRLGEGSGRFDQWAVSGYWSRTVNAKTGAFVEVYQLFPIAKGGPDSMFADAGFVYLLDKATQVDIRFGSGFNKGRDGWFAGAGIAFRF